jgi:predicted DCC family thiol-disulfide oxidoreductase YuxK
MSGSSEAHASSQLRIFYDAECEFCEKNAFLLRRLLWLKKAEVLKAQDYPPVLGEMQQHNSWVVENSSGEHFFKWEGLSFVMSRSPIFWPLSPLMRLPGVFQLGTRLYERIARRRSCRPSGDVCNI